MDEKLFKELKEKGEIGYNEISLKQFVALSEFFNIHCDGDSTKCILKNIDEPVEDDLKIKGGEKLSFKEKEELKRYFKEVMGIRKGVITIKEVQ